MSAAFYQARKLVSVPGAGNATFKIPYSSPLERLTIWAVSGSRAIVNMTFQARINGQAFNPSVGIVGRIAADVILSSGGAATEDLMLPFVKPSDTDLDPFTLDVFITNADATAATITMLAVAREHVGG